MKAKTMHGLTLGAGIIEVGLVDFRSPLARYARKDEQPKKSYFPARSSASLHLRVGEPCRNSRSACLFTRVSAYF